jgi:excinuclease ABC subunit C
MSDYQAPPHLQTLLENLPTSTGVYQMINPKGRVIYVGKAKNLRSRVRSYFQPANKNPKVIRMRQHIDQIKILILENELVALNTEAQLISAHQPQYNVIWKDDKRYPYIIIRWKDDFPKIEITRRIDRKDGNYYFGPYASAWAVRETLEALRRVFPYLTCDRVITGQDERACLYYDIKLCGGPCIGAQGREAYRANIQGLMDVLGGEVQGMMDSMQTDMEAAAEILNFEKAAILRDRMLALKRATMRQHMVGSPDTQADVLALAQNKGDALVQMFIIRKGRMIASESFPLANVEFEDTSQILESFIKQYYAGAASIPKEIIVPEAVPEADLIQAWLAETHGGAKVKFAVPQRGDKYKLLGRAAETAAEQLTLLQAQWAADTLKQEGALNELQQALGLAKPPNRIECYDISTLQGTATVASRVVFVQGVPRKSEYRKFNIKTIQGDKPDDFGSMREALTRRFKRYVDSLQMPLEEAPPGKDQEQEETWRILPDLLLIDGGKGQLGVAVEVLEAFNLREHVPVVSIAKQFEELFLPGRPQAILLARNSPALQLVQRLRDEAHRFGITANRQQREKKGLASRLETIPGIGPARRKALLLAFNKDIEAIREASLEELMEVPGINLEIAQALKSGL